MEAFPRLVRAFEQAEVRFVLIGVWGANLYAGSGRALIATQDFDLLLPEDADDALRAWQACRGLGQELWLGGEALGKPLDRWLAEPGRGEASARPGVR